MTMILPSLPPATDDADLVAQSVAGSHAAFARIVSRYQSLVCSIGYSATGNISQSEDLAQETFLAAWRSLRELREPERLRAWLCGIARNIAHGSLRRAGREPAHAASDLDDAAQAIDTGPLPVDSAISDEEQTLLWRAIGEIPPIYREPLVLYYREHQSVEAVADALDISLDAARQRLSRGRKLLHEHIAGFVEGALARSVPRADFTRAVIAALPIGPVAVATATSTATAKVGAIAKSISLASVLQWFAGPAIGAVGAYFGVRTSLDAAVTPRERSRVWNQLRVVAAGLLVFIPLLLAFTFAGGFWLQHPVLFALAGMGLPLLFALWLCLVVLRFSRELRVLRAAEQRAHPQSFLPKAGKPAAFGEYRSAWTLLGLPLVHIQFGTPPVDGGWARGWIAAGDRAFGVLFAFGAVSVGGISVGAVSVGLVSVGSVAVGAVAAGTLGVGVLGFGAMAIGKFAMGAYAVGWTAAAGAIAVAHEYAWGEHAVAWHANDLQAGAFMLRHHAQEVFNGLLALTAVLVVLPSLAYAALLRRRRRTSKPPTGN